MFVYPLSLVCEAIQIVFLECRIIGSLFDNEL